MIKSSEEQEKKTSFSSTQQTTLFYHLLSLFWQRETLTLGRLEKNFPSLNIENLKVKDFQQWKLIKEKMSSEVGMELKCNILDETNLWINAAQKIEEKDILHHFYFRNRRSPLLKNFILRWSEKYKCSPVDWCEVIYRHANRDFSSTKTPEELLENWVIERFQENGKVERSDTISHKETFGKFSALSLGTLPTVLFWNICFFLPYMDVIRLDWVCSSWLRLLRSVDTYDFFFKIKAIRFIASFQLPASFYKSNVFLVDQKGSAPASLMHLSYDATETPIYYSLLCSNRGSIYQQGHIFFSEANCLYSPTNRVYSRILSQDLRLYRGFWDGESNLHWILSDNWHISHRWNKVALTQQYVVFYYEPQIFIYSFGGSLLKNWKIPFGSIHCCPDELVSVDVYENVTLEILYTNLLVYCTFDGEIIEFYNSNVRIHPLLSPMKWVGVKRVANSIFLIQKSSLICIDVITQKTSLVWEFDTDIEAATLLSSNKFLYLKEKGKNKILVFELIKK